MGILRYTLRISCAATLFALSLAAVPDVGQPGSEIRITTPIQEGSRAVLAGNVRPEVGPQTDRGIVADDLVLDHIEILLKRSDNQESALTQYLESLSQANSPNFHKWLSPEQFGHLYGVSDGDIQTVTAWLMSHGFTVNRVYPNHMLIDVSGTAGQVREAFHTEIHHLSVNGETHIANVSNPQIPTALATVVTGVVSLNNFRPHKMVRNRPMYTATVNGSTVYPVVPADLATIYNFSGAFASGYTGTGQTIYLIEDTDVYSTADWSAFRAAFGLSKYTGGSFTQVHPGGCVDPGANGAQDEAILDAEWASAAAPNAAIILASCADTSTEFGGLLALQQLLNEGARPQIVSISYGECEAANGAAQNAAYNSAYQQAAAEGTSVYVSAGDDGAAVCDPDSSSASHGIGVNAFASTAYNVAVGGTDFSDTSAGTTSTYWNSSNSSVYGSAKSYIPEIPWNDSCASSVIYTYLGFSSGYGRSGLCNSSEASSYGLITTAAGSGGPSGCATGSPSISGVVSGSCRGYTKPSWQSAAGVPSDGVRDLPDVSLFASNGVWNHYYVFCWSNTSDGGATCSGAPSGWSGAGGTSFAAPIWAGIQALVNQKYGGRQGNPNPTLYKLASSSAFHDVAKGDMDVNCSGPYSCYGGGTREYGALSTTTSSFNSAFGAHAGWDFATGIGTVNVTNLVNGW